MVKLIQEAFDQEELFKGYQKKYMERSRKEELLEKSKKEKFHKQMLKLMQKFGNGGTLLDFGCGSGYFLHYAERERYECYGIDLSTVAVENAKQVTQKTKLVVENGEESHFEDGLFDFVTCFGSLEHFLNVEKGAKEIARLMDASGVAIITLPNSDFLYWKVTGKKPTTGQPLERYATEGEWRNLLEENGLKVMETKWFFCPSSWVGLKRRPIEIFGKFVPRKYQYHFVFICSKKEAKKDE